MIFTAVAFAALSGIFAAGYLVSLGLWPVSVVIAAVCIATMLALGRELP